MRKTAVIVLWVLLGTVTGCGLSTGGDPTVRADPGATATPSPPEESAQESAQDETGQDETSQDETSTAPDAAPEPESDSDAAEGDSGDAADESAAPEPDAVPPSDQVPINPDDVEQSADRIVVQSADAQLFTVTPDGGDRIDLTNDLGRALHSQPTWSPDGSRIAWVTISRDEPPAIRSDRFDVSSPTSVSVESPPFYLSWGADSARVAYLAPSAAGIDLGLAPITDDPAAVAQRLDRGQPYFFSWGPEPDELLIHASGFRLDRIKADGTTRIIEEFPAPFGAPAWLDEEDTFVYADEVEGVNYLVTTGTLGEGRVELASFTGSLRFSVNPTATRVAMLAAPASDAPEDNGFVTASFQAADEDDLDDDENPFADDNFDAVDVVPPLILSMMGTFGGELWPLSYGRVEGWFWDPSGDRLAWLESDGPELRWFFNDGNETIVGPAFVPSDVFARDYLPFFDQYGQSMTLFSPDGSEITFAGTLPGGESGIFVVDTATGSATRKIADGVFSAWSPTSAGGAFSVL